MLVRYAALALASSLAVAIASPASAQTVVPDFVTAASGGGYALYLDGSQNLYVSENNAASIFRFPASGNGTVTGGSTSSLTPLITGTTANSLWIDGAGNIYVSALTGTVNRYPPSGGTAPGAVFATVTGAAAAIAFDHAGNLYVADNATSKVYKFLSTNACLTSLPCAQAAADATFSVATPSEIAVDLASNIYVSSNIANGSVTQITPSGAANTSFISGLTGGATGVSVDWANNIYVSHFGGNRIVKFAATGGAATGGTPASPNFSVIAATGVTSPVQSAIDKQGNLYVANDAASGSVTEIVSAGQPAPAIPALSSLGLVGMGLVLLTAAWRRFRGRPSHFAS